MTGDRFPVLVRHFFGRFFDQESISPNGEAETNLVQILGILAVPSAFFVLVLQPLSLGTWALVSARYFFLSYSMVVTGFVMVFEWDMLFPDARDFQILTPLPVRLASIFLAKAAALAIFLAIFLIDINFFGVLLWPGVDGRGGMLRTMGIHIAAMAASGLFAALSLAALQGVMLHLLPARAFRRVSTCVQTVLMAALVMMLFVSPVLAPMARNFAVGNHPVMRWFPGYWFLGLYECMKPATRNPALLAAGRIAMFALAGSAALFLATYLLGYRRHARKVLQLPEPSPARSGRIREWTAGLWEIILRDPAERAIFHFISQTIRRSPKHRLFLATYAGFGAAVAVTSFAPGGNGLIELPLSLSFVLVSGLRAACNFPSELRANWMFRVSETDSAQRAHSATRKWILLCGILPLFLLLAPLEFGFFTPGAAVFHIAFGLALSAILTEILFFGFRKVPFTCAYFPRKVNLAGLSAIYVFGFTMYSRTMAAAQAWLASWPAAAAGFFLLAGAGCAALAWTGGRRRTRSIDYEDAGDPAVRTLDLSAG